tara:strand:- start:24 stop:1097 length:1074 start_codon:yes stop_codon:yes gene_type:complete
MKIYDIAFIGLGASSLATIKLKYSYSQLSIIGIDKEFKSSRNNFFAFWLTDWMKSFESIITQKWNKWSFYYENIDITHTSNFRPYCVIRFQEWKKFCLENIHNINYKENKVIKISKKDDCYKITLDNNENIFAKKIYDSRSPEIKKDGLKQHFVGQIIQTTKAHKMNIATLMDFRVSQEKGLHFMYCLPINDNQILVESTIFSKNLLPNEWYKHQIRDYINQKLQLEQFEIIEEEKGILPMYEIKNENTSNYVNIGTRGGATKISTGYAFSFFLKKLTSNIENYHSYWDEWMDKIFVHFLLNNLKTEHIFIKMSQTLTGDEFSSFMMGIADFKTKIKVIFSMPKKSFIKSFISTLFS